VTAASNGQYSAHGVATGTTEYVTMAEKFASDTCKCYTQQKALFPYRDPCHVSCRNHKLSLP